MEYPTTCEMLFGELQSLRNSYVYSNCIKLDCITGQQKNLKKTLPLLSRVFPAYSLREKPHALNRCTKAMVTVQLQYVLLVKNIPICHGT